MLNIVPDSTYTQRDRSVALSADPSVGRLYLQRNIDVSGAFFFIKLSHYEGEFAVGLGRRMGKDQRGGSSDISSDEGNVDDDGDLVTGDDPVGDALAADGGERPVHATPIMLLPTHQCLPHAALDQSPATLSHL